MYQRDLICSVFYAVLVIRDIWEDLSIGRCIQLGCDSKQNQTCKGSTSQKFIPCLCNSPGKLQFCLLQHMVSKVVLVVFSTSVWQKGERAWRCTCRRFFYEPGLKEGDITSSHMPLQIIQSKNYNSLVRESRWVPDKGEKISWGELGYLCHWAVPPQPCISCSRSMKNGPRQWAVVDSLFLCFLSFLFGNGGGDNRTSLKPQETAWQELCLLVTKASNLASQDI